MFLYDPHTVTVRKIFRSLFAQIIPVRIKCIREQIFHFGIQNNELGQVTKAVGGIDVFQVFNH